MGKFYKLFAAPRTVFCMMCVIMTTLFPVEARAAKDSVFTVQGVNVDVTADSAAAAREQAFAQAQNAAFRQLAERLLSESQLEYFEMPATSVISTLVKDFEITQEQLSNVRYIGDYTFRFKNDAVRNYLGAQGFAYTDLSSKPVLVLPYYQWGAQSVLWSQNNPWRAAWSSAQSYEGLVPVIVPIGDVQDVSDIGDNEALTFVPEKLRDMTERYGAGETIIMIATPEWNASGAAQAGESPDRLTVMVYRTDRGPAEFANKLSVAKSELADGQNIFAYAVQKSRSNLQTAWKQRTLVNAGQGNNIKVRVKFDSMKEWIETQKQLRRVQGVSDMKLVSLKQNEANVELQFQGSEHRLRLALAQSDMTLTAPRVDFNAPQNSQQPYDPYGTYGRPVQQQRHSPLIYDLYLNKYKRY